MPPCMDEVAVMMYVCWQSWSTDAAYYSEESLSVQNNATQFIPLLGGLWTAACSMLKTSHLRSATGSASAIGHFLPAVDMMVSIKTGHITHFSHPPAG
jgi:hypothetical protein